jgi:hypothetical protein
MTITPENFKFVLIGGIAAIAFWLRWQVFVSRNSTTDKDGGKRPYSRRERLLFVGFLLIGLAGLFFDPFPKTGSP